jgi:outer membrane protein assembly factor BamA
MTRCAAALVIGLAGVGAAPPVVAGQDEPLRLAAVTYAGFAEVVPSGDLSRLIARAPLAPGEQVDPADVQVTAQLALDLLRDAGYPNARVTVTETAVSPQLVQLTITGEPGAAGYFGPIEITGNERVDDWLIRRYVAYRPGERFRLSLVRETRRRLALLGLFASVEIERVEDDAPPSEVRTRIHVEEQDHRRIDFSLGYGTEEQVSGQVEWRDVNFLGGARRLLILGRWSWLDRGLETELVEPYLFRPDLSLAFQGRAWSVDERLFDVLSLGGSATISHRAGPHDVFSLTYTHQYERSRVADAALVDPALRADLATLGLNVSTGVQAGLLSALQVDLIRDTRDVPADPRRGYRASMRLERAGGWLPGAFDYYAALADGQYLRPAAGVTLVLRARYGSIAATGPATGVPYFKRYFLGGAEDLRGWGRLEVSPLSEAGQPLGGQAFFATTAEVRVPILPALGAVVFADAGTAWRDAWTLRLNELQYDAGVGARYWSPIGLLRVDVGYQLTPIEALRMDGKPQDRRWRVHFGIGPAS